MYNVVIIEDEPLARKKLQRLLTLLPDKVNVLAELASVEEVNTYLAQVTEATKPDLIFSDIELSDGNVFSCYQQQMPPCPIIFITAYDQFMLPAFDSFGIAYVLKPYNEAKLIQAWDKFCALSARRQPGNQLAELQALLQALPAQQTKVDYPSRIAIRQQQHIYFLELRNLVYLQADGSLVMAFDNDGKRHYLPYTSLSAAEQALDPTQFFRINRSEMVQSSYIDKLERYCKNTLSVYLKPLNVQLKTSQSRTTAFTRWLGI